MELKIFLCVVLISYCAAADLEWWQKTVFYQIYPRSFQDSDGDGVGDLKGIQQRIKHLKDTGIGAAWISPIFQSPMVDFGYDISDFRAIDPLFGTMEDFDNLVTEMKSLGLKLVLDFVPNHSSDKHEWFKKSINKEGRYSNYYVWLDGIVNETGRYPPNNWVAGFGGGAWDWNEDRQQYYLHQYAPQQPDLNYRNQDVLEEMKDVLNFWLDKGVNGFRADSVSTLVEDDRFLDEPEISGPDDLDHIYTRDLPETYEVVKFFRRVLDDYAKKTDNITRVLMTEAYSDINKTMAYYGNDTDPGAHFPFNFGLIFLNNNSLASDFSNTIHNWVDNVPKGKWGNWVVGNHDQHRVASRYGSDLADGLNMMAQLLPGTAVTYNGEEIAMVNTFITWEQCRDPQGINAGPDHYLERTRDLERTPFQWDDSLNAGFSDNVTGTWLPVNENYRDLNLKNQIGNETSHYKVYEKLVEARNTDVIQAGDLTTKVLAERVFAFTRQLGDQLFLFVMNLDVNEVTINFTDFDNVDGPLKVYVASISSKHKPGDLVSPEDFIIESKEALVLENSS